eukprot:1156641-Pelagomonas_calceolata.AAC.10
MVGKWAAKFPEWAPPDPGPSKGIHKSMLMQYGSNGGFLGDRGGWTGKVKTKIFGILTPKFCPLHPRSPKLDSPRKRVSLASLLSFRGDGRPVKNCLQKFS